MINIERQPNTIYVLSLSYGKDSIATLEACRQLGYPVDAVVHSEVWFNDEISADLPPMLEFKKYADRVIKERYGLDVTHICAMKKQVAGGGVPSQKLTYCDLFYTRYKNSKNPRFGGGLYGFPLRIHPKCQDRLKGTIPDRYYRTLANLGIPNTRKGELVHRPQDPTFTGFHYSLGRTSGAKSSKRHRTPFRTSPRARRAGK